MPKENKRIYTVSEITQGIKSLLEEKIGEVWLEGEISNFKAATSGHFYFSLKDNNALIAGAMFAYANKGLKFKIEDGLKVLCFGKIAVFAPRGQYQIIVEKIEPVGAGAQQLALEQLKKKLQAEGLFDLARKRALPAMPFRIGIVNSASGAALRDIMQVLQKGAGGVDLIIRSARVQGEGAYLEIAQAIEDLNAFGKVDLIIVSRGGGSSEDLWSFNEEIVARAIYNSKIPVVSAVGHQINTTLADLAADVYVETPSAAAKLIVDSKNILLAQLADRQHDLFFFIKNILADFENELTAFAHALKSPRDRLLEKQQQLDELFVNLQHQIRHTLQLSLERSSSLISRLSVLNPLAILGRGYSLSTLIKGETILKDFKQLKKGDLVKTILGRGAFISSVQEVIND